MIDNIRMVGVDWDGCSCVGILSSTSLMVNDEPHAHSTVFRSYAKVKLESPVGIQQPMFSPSPLHKQTIREKSSTDVRRQYSRSFSTYASISMRFWEIEHIIVSGPRKNCCQIHFNVCFSVMLVAAMMSLSWVYL